MDRGRSSYPNPNPRLDSEGLTVKDSETDTHLTVEGCENSLDDIVPELDSGPSDDEPDLCDGSDSSDDECACGANPNHNPRYRAKAVSRDRSLNHTLGSGPSVTPNDPSRHSRLKTLGGRHRDSSPHDPTDPKVYPKGKWNSGLAREEVSHSRRKHQSNPNPNPSHTVEVRSVEGKGVRYDVLAQECCGVWQHSESECTPSPNPKLDPNPSHKKNARVRIAPEVNVIPNPLHATNTKVKVSHDDGKLDNSEGYDHVRAEMRETLASIRSLNTIEKAKEQFNSTLPAYTVFEQATGGCLGTIAAANAGFRHLGGSEDLSTPVGKAKGNAFQELTNRRCFHDARKWEEWEGNIPNHFDYYKAGMPCPDYAALGKKFGCKGNKGGDLFILQLLFIECKLPKVVCLEMVPSALDTNDGDEVRFVLAQLSHLGYTVHADVLKCWEHGDPTARKRLFIVGIHECIASKAEWVWPEPVFNTSRYPIARDIAVPDDKVPEYYRRHDRPNLHTDRSLDPKPGRIQHIGYAGTDPDNAGYSNMPNNIQGWDGIAATQLGTNGGSRRVMLGYKLGDPIMDTRMTVPLETCRYASLHEESYMRFARKHYPGKKSGLSQDQWLRELINLGIPLATGTAIDMAVRHALITGGAKPYDELVNPYSDLGSARSCSHILPYDNESEDEDVDDGLTYPMDEGYACQATKGQGIQGLTVSIGDSGASDNLGEHSSFAPHMRNVVPAKVRYATAGDGTYIEGVSKGDIDISVLNLSSQPQCSDWVDTTTTITTVKGIGESLFSLEAFFRDQGYDIHLSHGYTEGDYTGLYRPSEKVQIASLGTSYGPESFIPMVYNWRGQGGWKVPYVIRSPGTTDEQHRAILEGILNHERSRQSRVARRDLQANTYSQGTAQQLERLYWAYSVVAEQLVVRSQGERNIRPAFSYGGLRRHKGAKWHDLHSNMAHLGEPGKPCTICSMFKGESRRMPKHREGKPRELRPGHTWSMDMITFRYRSEEGCKYLIVLTDNTTQFYQLIPLYWKSDATIEIKRWIQAMRGHPALQNLPYTIISRIITDNDGAWSEDNAEFQAMIESIRGIEIEYGDPADHARDNARAEGANKIIEAGIQSVLYERNLPPTWWQRAASDVMWLANRLPVYSLDGNIPSDGDYAPPIEQMFHGYVSRNQIYRELDSYVGVGTPALCHMPKVKGSDLEPKVRWGIALGRRGKVTRWMCPFSRSVFRTRSFTAHILRQGLNYSQFLGLGDIAPGAQSRMLPQDEGEAWTIELPEQRPCALELPPPVREILDTQGDQLALLHPTLTNKDLCEFYPRLTRRDHRRLKAKLDDDSEQESDSDAEPVGADIKSLEVIDSQGRQLELEDAEPLPGEAPLDNLHVDGCDNSLDDSDDEPPTELPDPDPDPDPKEDPAPTKGKHKVKAKAKAKGKRGRPRGKRLLTGEDARIMDDLPDLTIPAYGIDSEAEDAIEEYEAEVNAKYALTTDGKLTWARICKHMHAIHNLVPHERHNTYRLWLLTKPIRGDESQVYVEDLPLKVCNSRTPISAGLVLPYPSGPHWNRLCGDAAFRKSNQGKISPDELEEEHAYMAMSSYVRSLNKGEISLAHASKALLAQVINPDDFDDLLNDMIMEDIDDLGCTAYCARKYYSKAKKTRKLNSGSRDTIATASDPAPKTIVEALMGDRAEGWVESIYKEFNGLCDQGVFSHDWSTDDLKNAGIIGKPVPCSEALTHKTKDGVLEKLKTRICIAGHKGNVTQGIHYTDVFSPSPIQHTERILQAMRVNLHLHNLTWDVKMAYTWAPLPVGERIAVVYPDGFKHHDDQGNELYAVLERSLYGMPSAGRGWGKHRDQFILERFNRTGWSCKRSFMDPCLFVIDRDLSVRDRDKPPQAENRTSTPAARVRDTSAPSVESTGQETEGEGQGSSYSLPSHIVRSWVLIHTDDCDAYGECLDTLHDINDIMNDKWTTEIVDSSFVLGVKRELIIHDDDTWSVRMSMTAFISDLYDVFKNDIIKVLGRRVPKIPFPDGLILSKSDTPHPGEVQSTLLKQYQRLVGSLLWYVRHISPISAYGCSQLCKLMACPTSKAWEAGLWMLAYLYANKVDGILFTETDSEPVAFVDASNKDDPTDGKTQYGYAIMWGGPLICKSSKLNHVGINSTYNEYMALHHVIKQIVWLRQLFFEIGLAEFISKPTLVHADNKQANSLCSEDLVTQGNMYFRTGYHYCKEAVRDEYVTVEYIDTALNIADTMTKALASNKIKDFHDSLHGLAPLPDSLLTLE